MKWISVKDELPIEGRVIAAWGTEKGNIAEMDYVNEIVRGKPVNRFKWRGKISPWQITHWMNMPSPPEEL